MKGGTLQICWHSSMPVLTLDFHPISGLLATGGADNDIKLWLITKGEEKNASPAVSYQTSLAYHGAAVNVLRFSHAGDLLASGADGGELFLWKSHSSDSGDTWKFLRSLPFHRKDVLDLQWSLDGTFLLTGSVDNSCIIWDVNKGGVHQILDGHSHYVQGVAWDPLGMFVASLSSDRTCRIYANKPIKAKGNEKIHYACQHVIVKAEAQITEESKSTKDYLFHDETLTSFFRRLEWSPDGSFLLVPAGLCKYTSTSSPTHVNTAYVFSRKDLSRPALMVPGASKPIVAVRFCPITFNLQGLESSSLFKLPYRLIFAVATFNSIYIYDTEGIEPIAVQGGIHYAAITDIAWSPDGKYLAVSSQDNYCSLFEFENGELGSPISLEEKKAVGDEQSSPSMPDGVCNSKAEPVINASGTDIGKEKAESKGKEDQASVTATTAVPPLNQPARRRITPMAID